MNKFLYKLLHL